LPAVFVEHGAQWRVIELANSAQLVIEGRALRHCVGSYTSRCISGLSRIWSLRRTSSDGTDVPVLTIEIALRKAMVVQVRGRNDQHASGLPAMLVRQWIVRERLRVALSVQARLSAQNATYEARLARPAPDY